MKHFRLFLFVALLGVFVVSCNNETQKDKPGNTHISGTLPQGKGKVVQVQRMQGRQPVVVDKDSLTGDRFVLGFDIDKPEILYLNIQGSHQSLPVLVSPGQTLEISLNPQNIRDSKVEKGDKSAMAFAGFLKKLNEYSQASKDLENRYREAIQKNDQNAVKQIQNEYAEQQKKRVDDLFKLALENKDNLTGAIILQMITYEQEYDPKRAKDIYDQLAPEVQKSSYAQDALTKIQRDLTTAIGQKAPDFEAPDPNGKPIRMSDILKKSKVLVIDFWASWCRPCRRENPYVVEIYKKYHPKGLNILGVSLDRPGAKDKWLKAIKDDGLDWYHVSNLQFWQDPVARKYGIQSIPATLILDANGVIRAKNLRRDKLEAKIKELIDEASKK